MTADSVILGIDTSAYTTSVAIVNRQGILFQARKLLPVPAGSRGLRPGDAVFFHVQNLPGLLDGWQWRQGPGISAVCASVKPRPTKDSYLPPFVVGQQYARVASQFLDVPFFTTTHQEGHIRAGLYSVGQPLSEKFAVLHISGGTTELLSVTHRQPGLFDVTLVGGSDDLYAGQFVDRVGVKLGLDFPAGPALESLAKVWEHPLELPVSAPRFREGLWWTSFSGPESEAVRRIDQGANPADLARGVEMALARSLSRLVQAATSPGPLLVVGGVAANGTIRNVMRKELEELGWVLHFATPDLIRDNAVGVAYLGLDRLVGEAAHGSAMD